MSETVYSWSRLNSYAMAEEGEGCYYGWFKAYIEGDRGDGNYFSSYGTLFHETIEKMHKGELLAWDVDDVIKDGLNNIEYRVPFEKMRKSYEDSIYRFFNKYEEVFSDYQIQQAEEEKLFKIGDVSLKGFPDLIGQHKRYGMFIGDYKTSKPYKGDKLKHNIMQLYLYSIPFYEEYGYYPDYLIYFFVREKEDIEVAIKFDIKELERTKSWVIETVSKIESHNTDWQPLCIKEDGSKNFYACNLCNHRLKCEHRYTYSNSVKDNNYKIKQ